MTTATHTDEDPRITDPDQRWLRFGQGDHVRMYCKQDFTGRLTASGWTVNELGAEAFGRETFRKYGITERSVLYVGSK